MPCFPDLINEVLTESSISKQCSSIRIIHFRLVNLTTIFVVVCVEGQPPHKEEERQQPLEVA